MPGLQAGLRPPPTSSHPTAPYLHFTTKQKVWFFHNNFIDIAVAFGTVGLLVVACVLLDTARRIIRHFARSPGYVEAWPILFLAQLAFIVAFGVLLDTFVVRSLLVPALADDIGKRIWWPSRLARADD